ncbi:MAG: cysteine desulfuration protein SufE [Alphaproteobacteria bacterium]|nr:MAG: cysteine desulfuration protein SufE [Alphaproteobacteria bacterium]
MTKLQDIQDTFSLLDDWEDRYAYLIDLGRNLSDFPDEFCHDAYLVPGCTSRVWMILSFQNDAISIQGTSDAHIVRGLIALVIATYGGKTVTEVGQVDMEAVFKDLGLSEHLSPNRRNGFFSMVEKIKQYRG